MTVGSQSFGVSRMNEQVDKFVAAIKENAAKIWTEPDDKDFIDELVYVKVLDDGSVSICDNYERFFSTIYRVDTNGNWFYRTMYSDMPEREYSFEKAMGDASIMYTG